MFRSPIRRLVLLALALLAPIALAGVARTPQAAGQCASGRGHRAQQNPGCIALSGPLQGVGLLTPANFTITGPGAANYSILAVDNVTGNPGPVGVGFNPNNGLVYITDTDTCSPCHVTVLNPATGLVVANITSPLRGSWTAGVAVNPTTNHVYVAQTSCTGASNRLFDINGVTNTIANTITFDSPAGCLFVTQVAVNRQTNMVYVGENDCTGGSTGGGVFAVNPTTSAFTKITGPAIGSPVGVAVNETANKIYADNNVCGNGVGNDLALIDGGSNTVITSVPSGFSPGGLAFDPATGTVFATTGVDFFDPGKVSTFNGGTLAPGGSIAFARGMTNVRVVSGAGKIYATSVGGAFLAAINSNLTLDATIAGPANTLFANLDIDCATGRIFVSLLNVEQLLIIQGPAGSGCGGAPPSGVSKTCNPASLPAGGTTLCTLTLGSAVAGGTRITDQATGPGGATVTGCSAPAGGPLVCGPFSGNSGSAACGPSSGCPAGASFTLSITSPNPGPLAETVTLTPPSGAAQTFQLAGATFTAPAPPAGPNKVCQPSAVSIAAGGITSCTITLNAAVAQGTRITDQVTAPTGATITGCSAPPASGLSCGPTGSTSATLSCVAAGGCPLGATFTLTIQSRSPGTLSETVTIATPSGSQTFPLSGQATFG